MASERKRGVNKRREPRRRMPSGVSPLDQNAFANGANGEPGETAALPCRPDQWRVIVEMKDPLPVNSREIEIIEHYLAELIDDLLSAKAGK